MGTVAAKRGFGWAKKLGLMGRSEAAIKEAKAAIGGWECIMAEGSGSLENHIRLFEAFYFIGDIKMAAKHLRTYIEKEKRNIAKSSVETAGCRVCNSNFRASYLKGKEYWLHALATGQLGQYFQNVNHRPGIWVFDADGTLVQMAGYSWDMIDQRFGTEAFNREMFRLYKSNRISHETWSDLNLRLYQSMGLNKNTFDKIFSCVEVSKGAVETLLSLKSSGKRLALVSGGFANVLYGKIPLKEFEDVHINYLNFSESGMLKNWVLTLYGDGKGKTQPLHELKRKEKRSSKRFLAYVGDNENDLEAFNAADLAIAFNPKTDTIKETADVVIENDMTQILDFL